MVDHGKPPCNSGPLSKAETAWKLPCDLIRVPRFDWSHLLNKSPSLSVHDLTGYDLSVSVSGLLFLIKPFAIVASQFRNKLPEVSCSHGFVNCAGEGALDLGDFSGFVLLVTVSFLMLLGS